MEDVVMYIETANENTSRVSLSKTQICNNWM